MRRLMSDAIFEEFDGADRLARLSMRLAGKSLKLC